MVDGTPPPQNSPQNPARPTTTPGVQTAPPATPTTPPAGGAPQVLSPKEAFQQALSMAADDSGATVMSSDISEDGLGGPNVIDFVNNAIENAITLGVSDIHVEPYEERSRVRYRIDGTLREINDYVDFLFDNYSAIVTRIKIMASLDISERRLPQDGAIKFNYKNGQDMVDLRVSVLPTACGERVVMRIMDKSSLTLPLGDLGFTEQNQAQIEKAAHSPQGMMLVTGPTGSGKSTTLYAVLNSLNDEGINVMTAEDPVEFNIEGIGQVFVKDNIGLSFAAALRSFLRQDPEVIMVGEIRDKETAEISVKASLTGHLVLSTLHTNDAPSTITRLLNMGIPSYLLTSSLTLILAQRLAKKICENCKVDDDDPVAKDRMKAMGFSDEEKNTIKPQKGTGCDKCMDTGYKGRRAIHEVLTITKSIKEAILEDKSDIQIAQIAQEKDNFTTMQDRGRQLIAEGIVSLDEYQRVLVIED